jgi:beta-phosphoglucomutase-like phosphatase (HAD superfamily)
MLPCTPEGCVFVDDRDVALEAAREAGLQTVLFGAALGDDHDAVEDFTALTSRLRESVR